MPDAKQIFLSHLPKTKDVRWTIKRKKMVIRAVDLGYLSPGEVQDRYGLSIDEYLNWRRL